MPIKDFEVIIIEAQIDSDLKAFLYDQLKCQGIESIGNNQLKVYIDAEDFDSDSLDLLHKKFPDLIITSHQQFRIRFSEQDLSFEPYHLIDSYWIYSSKFLTKNIKQNHIPIFMKAGPVFGSGCHSSTQLVLELLKQIDVCSEKLVLDFGAGSGILSLYLARRGFEKILAVEKLPEALSVCQENIKMNRLNAVQVKKDLYDLGEQKFDLIVANVIGETLIQFSGDLTALLKPQGNLILSGILSEELEPVLQAYKNLKVIKKINQDDWWALLLI